MPTSGAIAQFPILHLISSLRVGGAERLLTSGLNAARRAGLHNFVVVIMNDEIDSRMRDDLARAEVPVYELMRRQGHLHPRYLFDIARIVRQHGIRVVHSHNDGSCAWGMAIKALMPTLKLVHTLHSTGVADQIGPRKRLVYRRLVDATVAISSVVEEEARQLDVGHIERIANGIDLSAFSVSRAPPVNGRIKLMNVGRFAHVKGQDVLIEAFRLLRSSGVEAELLLAGVPSEPHFYDALRKTVSASRLDDRISFVVDPPDVPRLLGEADIFVLPSRAEGFGLAVIEAMAAGVPAIGARTGGIATLIAQNENGLLFNPEDAADLAGQIKRLIADPALRARLAEQGHVSAQHFDINRTLNDHMRLYQKLVEPDRCATTDQSLARST